MPNEFGTKYSTSCNLYEQILVNNVGLDAKILNVCLITTICLGHICGLLCLTIYIQEIIYIYVNLDPVDNLIWTQQWHKFHSIYSKTSIVSRWVYQISTFGIPRNKDVDNSTNGWLLLCGFAGEVKDIWKCPRVVL